MNPKFVKCFFCLGLIFLAGKSNAQMPDEVFAKLNSVPQQSPQAAAMAKYIEFPVSYYTGLAQISFPIYEVKSGDISVSISLSYHGGGVKVQEEASWVGLGWSLMAGGMIAHEIKGLDDEFVAGYNNFYFPTPNGIVYDPNADVVNLMGCYANSPTAIYHQDQTPLTSCYELLSTIGQGTKDTEKDLYLYTFGSYSGKFFQIGSGYVDAGRNNIIFTKTVNGFSAVTPDGFTYAFEVKETSVGSVAHPVTIAHYLTQIKSPTGKVIGFQYKTLRQLYAQYGPDWYPYSGIDNVRYGNTESVPQMPALYEKYGAISLHSGTGGSAGVSEANNEIGFKKFSSQTFVSTPYLDKITFDNGYVSFEKSGRDDLYGAKLKDIKIYQLDGSLVKSIPFTYNYFSSTSGDDLFDPAKVPVYAGVPLNYPIQFRQKRLKLLRVDVEACPHYFEYYDSDANLTLPCKTSFSQDYWGYYNGKNNPSLVPSYYSYNLQIPIDPLLSGCLGGDRNPVAAFTQAASLKKIIYPTGGNSEFIYEDKTYDSQAATWNGNNPFNFGGGLRIKAIKHTDPATQKTLVRNFTYEGGKMMCFPRFGWTALMVYNEGGTGSIASFMQKYLYSSPHRPFSFSANGSLIGYDKVTESINDGSNGKTEYSYKNTADKFDLLAAPVGSATGPLEQYLPGVPTTGHADNGSLQSVKVYDNNNSLIKETISEQTIGVANTYWQLKYMSLHPGSSQFFYFENLKFNFYPIQVGKILTNKIIERSFSNGSLLSTIREFQYNNKGLLMEEKLTGSDGSVTTTNHKYASDYTGVTSGWLKDLKDKNFIGIPLEVQSKKNGLVTGGSFKTYTVNNGFILPSQLYKIEIAKPQSIASTAPNGTLPPELKLQGTYTYDTDGNLKQLQSQQDNYTSYLWGYNKAFPVATAINAEQKDIFYTSFEEGDGNSSEGDSKTGKKSSMGTFSKTLSGLSATGYVLSYWLKSNGIWARQLQAIGSSQIISGSYTISLSGQVDEISFYPKIAQMSTMTYEPLIGVTSQTNSNARSMYYEYDSRGRLSLVKDNEKNILKNYSYNCVGMQGSGTIIYMTPQWQSTGATKCVLDANGVNTGYQEREERDQNPQSNTYNVIRWVSNGYNTLTCSNTTNTCTGKSRKYINGICETGSYEVIGQAYDATGHQCIKNYGYVFSDASVTYDHTEAMPGPCY